jgi:hypothetical protein
MAVQVGRQIDKLVQERFRGDYGSAFRFYAGAALEVSKAAVDQLLIDANVPNPLGLVTSRIMGEFDTDRNGAISWLELLHGLGRNGVDVLR